MAQPPPALPQLLVGKTAIITGATTGIGRAIALAFVAHGCNVCVNHYPDAASAQQYDEMAAALPSTGTDADHASTVGQMMAVPGDVSLVETASRLVEETVRRWGRVDVFVSNAGICQFCDFLSLPPDLLTSTINTNLVGAYLTTQAAARQMAAQTPPGGSIIGISSISALVGGAGQTHYTPTKAGVLSLMQSAACALGRHGIRCNALLPGTVRTRLNDADLADPAKRAYMEGRVPLGRLGAAADLAGPAVFLACGELSGYVTGAQLLVDGGLFVNLQ